MNKRFLITGGAGFIGSHLIKYLISKTYEKVEKIIVVDNLEYSGIVDNLYICQDDNRVKFFQLNINDSLAIQKLLKKYEIDTVYHLAALTHVDHSISDPEFFINNNVLGTYKLITAVHDYYAELPYYQQINFKFVNISTDEVYGDYEKSLSPATESCQYNPSSPYSASKASADMILNSFRVTYKIPILNLYLSNNFGSHQYPEKLIPLTILKLVTGEDVNIYGDGNQVRQWIYVKDTVKLIHDLTIKWTIEDPCKYNIAGEELTNNQVVNTIIKHLNQLYPVKDNKYLSSKAVKSYEELVVHINDRMGHDRRYWMEDSLLNTTDVLLPKHNFDVNIIETIKWYIENIATQLSLVRTFTYEGNKVIVNNKSVLKRHFYHKSNNYNNKIDFDNDDFF